MSVAECRRLQNYRAYDARIWGYAIPVKIDAAYRQQSVLAIDMIEMLDALRIDNAFVAGHD